MNWERIDVEVGIFSLVGKLTFKWSYISLIIILFLSLGHWVIYFLLLCYCCDEGLDRFIICNYTVYLLFQGDLVLDIIKKLVNPIMHNFSCNLQKEHLEMV
jgi:hypothetical protein